MAQFVFGEMLRKPTWAENSIASITLDLGWVHRVAEKLKGADGNESEKMGRRVQRCMDTFYQRQLFNIKGGRTVHRFPITITVSTFHIPLSSPLPTLFCCLVVYFVNGTTHPQISDQRERSWHSKHRERKCHSIGRFYRRQHQ